MSVLVVHDELDLLVGKVKLKQGGSTNGHRGLTPCASERRPSITFGRRDY